MDRDKINHLKELIATDERFVGRNGRLLINKVQAAAKSYDPDLIALLRDDDQARDMFFQEIGDIVVFEGDKFIWTLDAQDYLEGSYTEYSQNIGLTVGGQRISDSDDVVLEFPYKDCVLEFDSTSEDEDRPEVMMNETLMKNEIDYLFAPKVLVNAKLHDEEGEHPLDTVPDDVNGIIIKGNNLLALHTLLPRYQGKIKMMYWDILYNTDNDQVPYNDSFKHSTWLVMMKNRLEIAKSLLSADGLICLQCDDNEQAYLKVLCDEVFGRASFLNCVAVKMSEASSVKMAHEKLRFPKLKEYILIYKKPNFAGFKRIDRYAVDKWDNENNIYLEGLTQEKRAALKALYDKEEHTENDVQEANSILNDVYKVSLSSKIKELGLSASDIEPWCFEHSYCIIKTAGSSSVCKLAKQDNPPAQDLAAILSPRGELYFYITDFNRNTKQPRIQVIFADENLYKNPCDFWQDIKTTGGIAKEGGVSLPNGKKPEVLIRRLISMITDENEIVLDAYLGSGTTAAVAHKMGRKYIGIEQLPSHIAKAQKRLVNVINGDNTGAQPEGGWTGGGSFISCELKKASDQFINRANEAESDEELVAIFNELLETPFVLYRVDIEKARAGFADLDLDEKREIIIKVIDKNTLYVNYDDIDNGDYDINDTDKAFTRSFYGDDEVK